MGVYTSVYSWNPFKEIEKAGSTVVEGVKDAAEAVKEEVIDPLAESLAKLDKWVLPDPKLRLDQVAFLASHNSHANLPEGFIYHQQAWGFDTQLEKGVRQFLIDVWESKAGKSKGQVLLCHGECETDSIKTRAGSPHLPFKVYLEKIKRFLDANPREIVSFELERKVSTSKVLDAIKSVPGLLKYVLTRDDYDPLKNGGNWPTLQWLIEKGKRLIIFDPGYASYGFKTDDYMIRNMYGTHDIDKACKLRDNPNPNSKLYQLNYFGTIASPLPIHNTPTVLQKVLKRCQEKGIVPKGKTPNFVALDFVDRGNAMQWINELNRNASKKLRK